MPEGAADVALYGHWICPFATRVEFALHQRIEGPDATDLNWRALLPY